MGASKSGRYLNTKGSGWSVSDFALVHSSEGAFTRSQTRVNGKMVIKLRLNNGGHSQKGMELLDKYGIEYNVVKTGKGFDLLSQSLISSLCNPRDVISFQYGLITPQHLP